MLRRSLAAVLTAAVVPAAITLLWAGPLSAAAPAAGEAAPATSKPAPAAPRAENPTPPTRAILLADLNATTPSHPRLIAGRKRLDEVKSLIASDPKARRLWENTLARADKLLTEPPLAYDANSVRLIANEINTRALELGVAYHLTGDPKYALRIGQELDSLLAFPHWNEDVPRDYLNCGNLSGAAGMCFDWAYDRLTPEQRKRAVDTILARSVQSGLKWHRVGAWWNKSDHNWNGVCNSGISLAALAILDENPAARDQCLQLLERTLAAVPIMLRALEPDGGSDEGVNYLNYGLSRSVDLMTSLPNVFGRDYGMSRYPGVAKGGDFTVFLTGSASTFNFGDCSQWRARDSNLPFLAGLAGAQYLAAYHYRVSEFKGTARDLLRYVAVPEDAVPPVQDRYFRGPEVVAMHTNLMRPDDVFVAVRAGGTAAHADNDRGTFFINALGQTWATDLGADSYAIPQYFSTVNTSPRWRLYRKSAQGHNTLVIGPSTKADQVASERAVVEKFVSGGDASFAIMNLTPVYKGATSVRRGVRLEKAGGTITVRDEIRLAKPADVWWFMHVDSARFEPDGPRNMRVRKNGKTLLAQITEGEGEFEVLDAAPLPGTADVPDQATNPKVRRLAIKLTNVSDATLNVVLTPVQAASTPIPPLPNGSANAKPPAPGPTTASPVSPAPSAAAGTPLRLWK